MASLGLGGITVREDGKIMPNVRVIEFWDTRLAREWLAVNGHDVPELGSASSDYLYAELCWDLFPDDEYRLPN